jgi:hypothetical protein
MLKPSGKFVDTAHALDAPLAFFSPGTPSHNFGPDFFGLRRALSRSGGMEFSARRFLCPSHSAIGFGIH